MECPFCAEAIKDEALACKHCSRDLRVMRPVLVEIQAIVHDLDRLQRDLDRVNARLARHRNPGRYFLQYGATYLAAPFVILLSAHTIVTIVLDVSQLHLRLASIVTPLMFGFAAFTAAKMTFSGVVLLSLGTALLSVNAMLIVTGLHDGVPIMPGSWIEWREVIEYSLSIFLAYVSGYILGVVAFRTLPGMLEKGGRPNAAAFKLAMLMGAHVGEEQLRRRARLIQDLIQTIGPLAGIAATVCGSLYAGLKGILG